VYLVYRRGIRAGNIRPCLSITAMHSKAYGNDVSEGYQLSVSVQLLVPASTGLPLTKERAMAVSSEPQLSRFLSLAQHRTMKVKKAHENNNTAAVVTPGAVLPVLDTSLICDV